MYCNIYQIFVNITRTSYYCLPGDFIHSKLILGFFIMSYKNVLFFKFYLNLLKYIFLQMLVIFCPS